MSPQHFHHEAELYGIRRAFFRLAKRRHLLPLLGYLVLAFGVFGAFAQERTHSNENRRAVVEGTNTALYEGCVRNNALRSVLVGILREEYPQITESVKSGRLTRAQAVTARKTVAKDIHRVSPVRCTPTSRVK